MYIQKSGKKFRLVERYKDPLTGKLVRVTIGLQDKRKSTIKEAKIALTNEINRRISQVKNGKLIHGITLEQLLDEFMKVYKRRVKTSTYYNRVTIKDRLLKELGKDTLVENITSKIIKNKLESMMYGENKISSAYVSQYKYFLNHIMDYAISQSYLKDNPVKNVELDYPSSISGGKIANKFFEEDELEDFLEFAYNNNETYAQLCEWLYLTGTRVGESTSLDFKDVYQKDGRWCVDITGTLEYKHVKIKDQKKSNSTKTVASTRTVILPKKAVKIYKDRIKITGGHGFIFCTSHGTPIQTGALNTFLRRAKKELEIDKPISTHIFWHTHISKLAELGIPLYVIQQRVGHEDSKITQQIYLHVRQEAIKKEADKLDKL